MQAFDRGKIGCMRGIFYFLCVFHIKNYRKGGNWVKIYNFLEKRSGKFSHNVFLKSYRFVFGN